jgi:hypothetical protein
MTTNAAEAPHEVPAVGPSKSEAPKQERERSTIDFPYLSLDVAIEIVKAVHETGGTRAEFDQVAAHIGESAKGSAFRNKVTTARTFGLATYSTGTITLTPLGSRLADPDQEKGAKAEAFLSVPLYKRLYEDFKGSVLPPTNAGLETVIEGLGVSTKQKDKARQAFQRSAQQAGFFAYGATKLVYPAIAATGTAKANLKVEEEGREHDQEEKGKKGGGGRGGNDNGQHPLIEGLLEELPKPKTEWPMEERKNWLEMASTIFNVIYKNSDDNRGSLRVVVEKASAK